MAKRLDIIFLSVVFIILSLLAKTYSYFPIDVYISQSLQRIHLSLFTTVMISISQLGLPFDALLSIALFALIALFFRHFKDAFFIIFSSLGVSLLGVFVKNVVDRPRPAATLVSHIGPMFRDFSFPSGHVLFFMGLYGFLLYLVVHYFPRGFLKQCVVILIVALLVLIGLSRIYLGDHWFSDVVGGYVLGLDWLLITVWLHHRFPSKFPG